MNFGLGPHIKEHVWYCLYLEPWYYNTVQGVHKLSAVQVRYLQYFFLNSVDKFSKPYVEKLRIFVIPQMMTILNFSTYGFEKQIF